ncbi:DUF427 domain-containing protein [Hoeflea sp. TYP-13]|uniref:DUF427 domain-containing protein n=1 Tax=Hoeflea sp. TYP-13 TaxID=3230023 RepID=UPI0034C5F3A7
MDQKVRVMLGDLQIAETDKALRLLEVGRRLYQPQYYIPREDIQVAIRQTDKSTHCPLKGDASYFSVVDESGGKVAEEIGWSYQEPFDFAGVISGHIAFDPRRVSITVEAANG